MNYIGCVKVPLLTLNLECFCGGCPLFRPCPSLEDPVDGLGFGEPERGGKVGGSGGGDDELFAETIEGPGGEPGGEVTLSGFGGSVSFD